MAEVKIGGGWEEKLETEFEQEYFKNLTDFVCEKCRCAIIPLKTLFP
jgi:uracil DNA glycosylase